MPDMVPVDPGTTRPLDSFSIEELERVKEADHELARSLVLADFLEYESYRSQNLDEKWSGWTALYNGAVEQRKWRGSNIPRASLPYMMTFDHVETADVAIDEALFGQPDWFDVEAESGVDPIQAQAVKARLRYILNHAKTAVGTTAQSEIRLATKQVLKLGNGGVKILFSSDLGHATIEWIDRRDVYFDPATPSPNCDEARSVVERVLMTVEEVEALRSDARFDIPSKEILYTLGQLPNHTVGDQTKQRAEIMRGMDFDPASNTFVSNPLHRQIEVLVYWSRTRCIWVIGRSYVIWNSPNPYGFIPYAFAPCYIEEGRFDANPIAFAIGYNQRYAQALRNGLLDLWSLLLHPPRAMPMGYGMSPSQAAWGPGALIQTPIGAEPKNAIATADVNPSLAAGVGAMIDQIDIASERSTGINAVSQGVPRPGNINRTASGVQSQMQGGALRLSRIVKNIEDYLITQMLQKLWSIEQFHQSSQQELPIATPNGVQNAPAQAFINSPVKFIMNAASKMLSREKMLQAIPMYLQTIGPMQAELVKTGQTIDFAEVEKKFSEALGFSGHFNFVRPLNEEEKAALAQPTPEMVAQKEKQQLDSETRLQAATIKAETERDKNAKELEAKTNETDAKDARKILELESKSNESKRSSLSTAFAPKPNGPPR